MANAADKLKNFGLRFGDKIAVLLAAGVFVMCLASALTRPTIEVTPDQIKKAAEQSESNLRRRVPQEEIVKTLVEGGLKTADFAKEAEESSKMLLVANDFKPRREWVTPEPGAGLIRDQPKLLAPENLYAYPGRGGAVVYALDAEGNRILEDPNAKAAEKPKYTPRRRRNRGGGGGSSMMGMAGMAGMMGMNSGMMGGGGPPQSPEEEKAMKAEVARKRRQMQARLSGADAPAKEEEKDAEAKKDGPPPKEITKGLRWVALTATLDHGKMLENYRTALKNPAIAQPNYRRLDVQRQAKQRDGSWGEWADVAADRNLEILDNLPVEDEELTPENVRPENLNDPSRS